jgi:hypothetical protein
MALPPHGERLPSQMNEGTDYGYKGHKGPMYSLGALGLLGPSPSAQFYSILISFIIVKLEGKKYRLVMV